MSTPRKLGLVLSQRLADSKTRAKEKSLPHNITHDHLKLLWRQSGGRCAISGQPFSLIAGDKNSPSLDQIKPGKGYTIDNVWLISDWLNKAKNDMELNTFYKLMHGCVTNLQSMEDNV